MAKLTSPILKKGAYVMAALVLAGSTVAVKAGSANARADYNWYEADEATGVVQANPIDPQTTCPGSGELCAIGLDRQHFNLNPTDDAPISNLSELSSSDMAFTEREEKQP